MAHSFQLADEPHPWPALTRPVEQSPLLTVGGGNGAWPAAGPLRGSKPKDTGGAAANRGAPANRFFLPLCPPAPRGFVMNRGFPKLRWPRS